MFFLILPITVPLGALIPGLVRQRGLQFFPGTKSTHPSFSTGVSAPYAYEAFGSFLAGLLFSMILGGTVPVTRLLPALPPLLFASALILSIFSPDKTSRSWVYVLIPLLLMWTPLCHFFLPTLEHRLEEHFWKTFQPGQTLLSTKETPYQHLQTGDYNGQKSLSINGLYAESWPDPIRAEERVHTFMTALASPSSVLVIGAPTTDMREEFAKYREVETTFIELDPGLLEVLSGAPKAFPRQNLVAADPRVFLRTTPERFDGIFFLAGDPTSLVTNRLFTREAFLDAARVLRPGGVLCFGIVGTENYLGEELEAVLLSAHRTVNSVFPEVFALPGDPILFWASLVSGNLATSPTLLGERFSHRNIPTNTFGSVSFSNRLLPFRVDELKSWLQRSSDAPLNTDAHPRAFMRQLQLWDVYSDSRLSPIIKRLLAVTSLQVLMLLACFFLLVCAFLRFGLKQPLRVSSIFGLGSAISGGASLVAELALIFLYQNRCGAMFQMTAFFFGIFMLGLTAGAIKPQSSENFSLFRLKGLQAMSLLILGLLVETPSFHEAIPVTAGIFWVAFLAGSEFPLLDALLRENHSATLSVKDSALSRKECSKGLSAQGSAGYLIWADNFGALFAAILAGPWLFPALGIQGTLMLAAAALAWNGLAVFFLVPQKTLRR
ncbi:MAG: hypothetical protein WA705_09000 [Candidatus Ozemobacteraceae bacterium]